MYNLNITACWCSVCVNGHMEKDLHNWVVWYVEAHFNLLYHLSSRLLSVRDTVLHPLLRRYLLHTWSQRSRRCGGRRYSYHQRRGWPHQLGRKERVLHLIKTGPLTLVSSLGHRAVFGAGARGGGGWWRDLSRFRITFSESRGVEK